MNMKDYPTLHLVKCCICVLQSIKINSRIWFGPVTSNFYFEDWWHLPKIKVENLNMHYDILIRLICIRKYRSSLNLPLGLLTISFSESRILNFNFNRFLRYIDWSTHIVLEIKIWSYWSEPNSWIYFYIVLNKNWKIYWSKQSLIGLGSEDRCSLSGLCHYCVKTL
jgi:hypothetical protein